MFLSDDRLVIDIKPNIYCFKNSSILLLNHILNYKMASKRRERTVGPFESEFLMLVPSRMSH